jgi:hypothetical protein
MKFFIDIILTADSGVESTSNTKEYQEYFLGGKGRRCVGLATSPPSCADCLEIWEPQPPGPSRRAQASKGMLYYYYHYYYYYYIFYFYFVVVVNYRQSLRHLSNICTMSK